MFNVHIRISLYIVYLLLCQKHRQIHTHTHNNNNLVSKYVTQQANYTYNVIYHYICKFMKFPVLSCRASRIRAYSLCTYSNSLRYIFFLYVLLVCTYRGAPLTRLIRNYKLIRGHNIVFFDRIKKKYIYNILQQPTKYDEGTQTNFYTNVGLQVHTCAACLTN